MPSTKSPTQVSFANFPSNVCAAELVEFLEEEVGLVLRCKVKKGNPDIPPHAFIHFESPCVAREALKKAAKGQLKFRQEWDLEARIEDRDWQSAQRGVNARVHDHIQLRGVMLELGSVTGHRSMLVSWRSAEKAITMRLELSSRRLCLYFTRNLPLTDCNLVSRVTRCDIMLDIRVQEIKEVREVQRDVDPVLLVQLLSPPFLYYRTAEDDVYEHFPDPSKLADDEDPWIRCLDIISPNKSFGRCLDYMLTVSARQRMAVMKMFYFFRNQDLLSKSVQEVLTTYVEDPSFYRVQPFFSLPSRMDIPFDIMFLLNALVARGITPACKLSDAFYSLLQPKATPTEITVAALTLMLGSKHPIYEPIQELETLIQRVTLDIDSFKQSTLADPYMLVRRLVITPTRANFPPSEVECSNRVLRHFKRLSDRFLRVSFMDEDGLSISPGSLTVQAPPILREVYSYNAHARTDLYHRVTRIMKEGFHLCGRDYQLLAFSAGQLRESSAWFFATDGHIQANLIRKWMGEFPVHNVAKHSARMGQCFSSTVASVEVLQNEVQRLEDIKRNDYIFSDGCGKISPEFGLIVAKILKLEDNPPSLYQIRYAGYKGVVGTWPTDNNGSCKLALRHSMDKFVSQHCQLEIVGWSKFVPCFLNRQIILLLSTLGVEDKVFEHLQGTMIEELNQMVFDRDKAYNMLMLTCTDEQHSTALRMLSAGFHPQSEAHLKSMLLAIRAGQLEDLVRRNRIFVSQGRWLMGCLDETAKLEYGQCFIQVTNPDMSLEARSVITGTIIMTKNPCMHPGDIRILQAVDIPELHHLADCLVFPQNGPRPHPNEASGSDLDGDMYFVSWDANLIPPSKTSAEPMLYKAQEEKKCHRVTIGHVIEFFAKHMVNDHLGKICNAHVVRVDLSPKGALDDNCLLLAELAAKAVDYPKSGRPAVMPFDLKPKRYPDFMEKDEAQTYRSEKIIGRLYRSARGTAVEASQFQGRFNTIEPTYDRDLEVIGFEAHVEKAWILKQEYDSKLYAIMSRFGVVDEGQVVTGYVRANSTSNRHHGDLKEKVRYAYAPVHMEYNLLLNSCHYVHHNMDEVADVAVVTDEELEAQASAWYHVTYHPDWYERAREMCASDGRRSPLLSFAWLGISHLAPIKIRKLKANAPIW